MKLQFVSFKLAKELEKIGFDEPTNPFNNVSYYNYKGIFEGDSLMSLKHRKDKNSKYKNVIAPTLELAKMWVRERYGINIYCYQPNKYWAHNLEDEAKYETYEEALEEALFHASNKILSYK